MNHFGFLHQDKCTSSLFLFRGCYRSCQGMVKLSIRERQCTRLDRVSGVGCNLECKMKEFYT